MLAPRRCAIVAVDFRQVQGLVRFGYRRLTEASFLLLTIRDAESARAWIRSAPVADAVTREAAPPTALHIAFTGQGLRRLGLADEVLAQFSSEFLEGMSGSDSRSRLLGDVGNNSPRQWKWGTAERTPHMLVLLYAHPGHLQAWSEQVRDDLWQRAFDIVACLPTIDLQGKEPFGFTDGVSQPTLDWDRTRQVVDNQLTYSNETMLGEFLLGYLNEYERYTERPVLERNDPLASTLPPAEEQPGCFDLGRDGCYLVLRTLEQDVQGFWRFIADRAGPDPISEQALAAAMVGRRKDGCPLVPRSPEPIAGVAADDGQNHFTFDSDKQGLACPFGAHIRRANPRNADLPTPPVHGLSGALRLLGLGEKDLRSDAKASARFHRLLRRGREYGPPPQADALASGTPPQPSQPVTQASYDPGGNTGHESQGIHFIALVANIARQFEFLQNAWLMSSKFDAGTDESDPLLGNREPIPAGPGEIGVTDTFSLPRENGLRERIEGLPQFVTVRGGAYFFLPSLPALQYLASLDGNGAKRRAV